MGKETPRGAWCGGPPCEHVGVSFDVSRYAYNKVPYIYIYTSEIHMSRGGGVGWEGTFVRIIYIDLSHICRRQFTFGTKLHEFLLDSPPSIHSFFELSYSLSL
jgi:hypothetical protein